MATANAPFYSFNRGTVSRLALGRLDVERLRLAGAVQNNFVPRVLGPMSLRAGLGYITPTRSNSPCRVIPFIFSSTVTAALEFTDHALRVLVDDVVVSRPAVATVISGVTTAGTWTTATTGGGTVSFGVGGVTLNRFSVGGSAKITQAVTLGASSAGVEHALEITVSRGPVYLRIGSTAGGEQYVARQSLETGYHSLAFTPTGTFHVQFEAASALDKTVASVSIAAAGDMVLTTPWSTNALRKIRTTQSADVVFCACKDVAPQRIERRGPHSWSVVAFKSDNGPFTSNLESDLTLTPSATAGNITITASRTAFKPSNVGGLIRMFHSGQFSGGSIAAENTFLEPVKVTGVGATRVLYFSFLNLLAGTFTLQRSFDGPDSGYLDVSSYTTSASGSYNDGFDNSIVWYRAGFKSGNYVSGNVNASLLFQSGGGAGVARVTGYTSDTVVTAEVLDAFTNTTATRDWKEGTWSDRRGWPTAVELFQGRLWWAGNDRVWGSGSDQFNDYDVTQEGEATAIDRTLGAGPIAVINWLAGAQRLIMGTDTAVVQAKSSSFDEPLTPTAFSLTRLSTQGSADLPAAVVDTKIVFAQQSNRRVYQILIDAIQVDYKVSDLTRLNEDIGLSGFADIAIQRQPDTHIHFVLNDGTVAVLLYDSDDEVEAWWTLDTDGFVENAYVLPGAVEDRVYYVVRRTVDGVTRRYHERFARMDECAGGTLNKQADSYVVSTGVARTTITGLGHLEGQRVVVWADGQDRSPGSGSEQVRYLVTGGVITLPEPATSAVVGLPYTGSFISAKLAYAAQGGTALTQTKRANAVGLVLGPTHNRGLRFKQDPSAEWESLPRLEDGRAVDANYVWTEYDKEMHALPGEWTTDARLVLEAQAPRPATVMAAVISVTTMG